MVTTSFKKRIKSEEELHSLIGEPSDLAKQKVISILDHHCTNFIEHSPFIVLSTSNSLGQCDVSPRGDAPGFIKVLTERTIKTLLQIHLVAMWFGGVLFILLSFFFSLHFFIRKPCFTILD